MIALFKAGLLSSSGNMHLIDANLTIQCRSRELLGHGIAPADLAGDLKGKVLLRELTSEPARR
jgi:hypothetical protein